MAGQQLVIFTAIAREQLAVVRGLGVRAGPLSFVPWPDFDEVIEVHTVGIGAVRLRAELPAEAGCVILAGFGGALDPSLRVGDVVLDWPSPVAGSPPRGAFRLGRIHASRRIVSTPEQKAALFRETGAAAVEMEGAAVRALLGASGVPLIGLRAITDAADESLDPKLISLVDHEGRPRPFALAEFLTRHPGRIGSLWRLGAAARLAGRRLGEAVSSLVRSEEMKRLLQSP